MNRWEEVRNDILDNLIAYHKVRIAQIKLNSKNPNLSSVPSLLNITGVQLVQPKSSAGRYPMGKAVVSKAGPSNVPLLDPNNVPMGQPVSPEESPRNSPSTPVLSPSISLLSTRIGHVRLPGHESPPDPVYSYNPTISGMRRTTKNTNLSELQGGKFKSRARKSKARKSRTRKSRARKSRARKSRTRKSRTRKSRTRKSKKSKKSKTRKF